MRFITLAAVGLATLALGSAGLAFAQEQRPAHEFGPEHLDEPEGGWSFEGPLGNFDQNSLQRGYKVYREVCSSCHSMKSMTFRNLGQKGGPFYDKEYANPNDNPRVKALAADLTIPAIDQETGDEVQVPAKTSDRSRTPSRTRRRPAPAMAGLYRPTSR